MSLKLKPTQRKCFIISIRRLREVKIPQSRVENARVQHMKHSSSADGRQQHPRVGAGSDNRKYGKNNNKLHSYGVRVQLLIAAEVGI